MAIIKLCGGAGVLRCFLFRGTIRTPGNQFQDLKFFFPFACEKMKLGGYWFQTEQLNQTLGIAPAGTCIMVVVRRYGGRVMPHL
jgi:hypothetical protein